MCVCRRVLSLLPRGSVLVHRLSTFPRRAAFAHAVRRSASPFKLTRLHLSSLHATARGFAAGGLLSNRPSGPASAGCLTTPRRGPRYSTAQRLWKWAPFIPRDTRRLHGAQPRAFGSYSIDAAAINSLFHLVRRTASAVTGFSKAMDHGDRDRRQETFAARLVRSIPAALHGQLRPMPSSRLMKRWSCRPAAAVERADTSRVRKLGRSDSSRRLRSG